MNWFEEAARSIVAAAKLAWRDTAALADFNNTSAGFWRSFSALFLIAPFYLFIASIDWNPDAAGAVAPASPQSQMLSLALQWMLWPAVMIFVTKQIGLGAQYSRYVIVYNWSNVLIIAAIASPAILFRSGIVSFPLTATLSTVLQFATIYLEWYLTRLSLATNGFVAAAIVLGNLLLSVAIVLIF